MPIYLARSIDARATHPLYKQKGLEGMTSAKFSDLLCVPKPDTPQLAFQGYKANIDIFVSATNRHEKLRTTVPAAALMDWTRKLLPLDYPSVGFSTVAKLSPADQTRLVTSLAKYHVKKEMKGDVPVYIADSPTPALLPILDRIANPRIAKNASYVSPQTFRHILLINRCISEFLCTNTYAAFPDNDKEMQSPDVIESCVPKENARRSTFEYRVRVKKAKAQREDGDQEMEEEDEVSEYEEELKTEESIEFALADCVMTAKPSPRPLEYNFGPTASVPASPGAAFPYFPGMMIADAHFIKRQIAANFFRSLGESRDQIRTEFSFLRSSVDLIASLPIGEVLSHLLMGVHLSLGTQTRMFVVMSKGSYGGFSLLGARWSIILEDKVHTPLGPDDFAADVAIMTPHAAALDSVIRILSSLKLNDGTPEGGAPVLLSSAELGTSRQLVKEILKRKMTPESKKELEIPLGATAFSRSYLPVNVENLSWALRSMTLEADKEIDNETPLFVPPSLSNIESRELHVLGAFGSNAPSFINASGNTYAIPPVDSIGADENLAKDPETGKRRLPYMLVGTKGVLAAVADARQMISRKIIRMDFVERAGRHRNREFKGRDFDALYAVVKETVGGKKTTVNYAEQVGTKRKRGEEEREVASSSEALFSFLGGL